MTAYSLNGLLSFRKTGAGFLIPCFALGGSNAAFAQEVDDHGRIVRFLPIAAERYHCDTTIPLGVQRRPGDEGVFAARLNDGSILTDGFEALRRGLAATDLESLGSPFFNVDALAFIGDLSGRDRAVAIASTLFDDAKIANEWRRLETRGRIAGLARVGTPQQEPEPQLSAAEWFWKFPRSEDWPRRWLAEWTGTFHRDELRDIALAWLDAPHHSGDPGPVFLALMAEEPGHWTSAPDLALRWLGAHHYTPSWFQTWDVVRRKFRILGNDDAEMHIADVGVSALNHTFRHVGPIVPADWARLWARLFRIGGQRPHLVGMALKVDQAFHRDPIFQQKVLATIAKRRRDRVETVLVPWLETSPIDNGWIGVYVNLDPRHLTLELQHRAVEFLAHGDVRFKEWRTLWTAMRKREHLHNVPYDEFARRWLARASRNLVSWPEVLADMIQLHPNDPELRHLAYSWLDEARRPARLGALMRALDARHRLAPLGA